jgi:predicted secreted protein
MAVINGTDIVLSYYDTATSSSIAFGAATNCTFNISAEQAQIAATNTGIYKQLLNGLISWDISSDGFMAFTGYSYFNLMQKLTSKEVITIKFQIGDDYIMGLCNIASLQMGSPVENSSPYSITLAGTGPYYINTLPTTTTSTTTIPPTTTTTSTIPPTSTSTSTTSTTSTTSSTSTTSTTSTSTSTTSTTSTTTTTDPYEYYIADEYDCATCTIVAADQRVKAPLGSSLREGRFYRYPGTTNDFVYYVKSITTSGDATIISTTPYTTCSAACGITSTTTSTTTTTTTTDPYVYYIADEYDCSTCTVVSPDQRVRVPVGTTLTLNRFYRYPGTTNDFVYFVKSTTTSGGAVDISTTPYTTCSAACAITSTSTSTTTSTTSTTSTTTTTTTTDPFIYYVADEYDCATCTIVAADQRVRFPIGTTVTLNRYYRYVGTINDSVYFVKSSTTSGGAVSLQAGAYTTCDAACGNTTTSTTTTSTTTSTTSTTTTTTTAPPVTYDVYQVCGGVDYYYVDYNTSNTFTATINGVCCQKDISNVSAAYVAANYPSATYFASIINDNCPCI